MGQIVAPFSECLNFTKLKFYVIVTNTWDNTASAVTMLEMQLCTVQVLQEGHKNLTISTSRYDGH